LNAYFAGGQRSVSGLFMTQVRFHGYEAIRRTIRWLLARDSKASDQDLTSACWALSNVYANCGNMAEDGQLAQQVPIMLFGIYIVGAILLVF